MSKTVGIIGLGLLGGSLAKALKAYTDYEVVGYARRQEVCDAALQDGVVSAAWTEVEPLIEHSDIVVFSLPPDTNIVPLGIDSYTAWTKFSLALDTSVTT